MAKTVVFESEKLEKRQKLMHLLLPLAVLAAVILIAVIVAVIVGRNKGKTHTGGENTLYPYEWTENKDGSLVFRLQDGQADGYVWTAANSVEDVADVDTEVKPPKGKVGFIVTPKAEGRTRMALKLSAGGEGSQSGVLCELGFILEVTSDEGKLKTAVLSADVTELPGVISGGEDEGWPYQIAAAGPRELMICLKDRMREIEGGPDEENASVLPSGVTVSEPTTNESSFIMNNWECTSSDETTVRLIGVVADEGLVTVRLTVPGEGESAQVVLRSEDGGAELSFTVKVEENGSFTVEEDKLTVFEPVIEIYDEDGEPAVIPEENVNP